MVVGNRGVPRIFRKGFPPELKVDPKCRGLGADET